MIRLVLRQEDVYNKIGAQRVALVKGLGKFNGIAIVEKTVARFERCCYGFKSGELLRLKDGDGGRRRTGPDGGDTWGSCEACSYRIGGLH